MNRSVIRPLVALMGSIALVTTFAGCGSDDKKDDAPARLTADEFKTQANAVCNTGNVELTKVLGGLATATSQEDADRIARDGAALIKKQGEDIDALAEPSDMSADVTAMVAAINEGVDAINEKGAAALTTDSDTFTSANEKAKALGLNDCGAE